MHDVHLQKTKKFSAVGYGPVIKSMRTHTTVTEPALIRFDQAQDDVVLQAIWAPCRATSSSVLESERTIMGAISASDLLRFRSLGRDPTGVRARQRRSYKPSALSSDTRFPRSGAVDDQAQAPLLVIDGGA